MLLRNMRVSQSVFFAQNRADMVVRPCIKAMATPTHYSPLLTHYIMSPSQPNSRCKRKLGEESPGSLGRVPGNAWAAQADGKCHRKYTA